MNDGAFFALSNLENIVELKIKSKKINITVFKKKY